MRGRCKPLEMVSEEERRGGGEESDETRIETQYILSLRGERDRKGLQQEGKEE